MCPMCLATVPVIHLASMPDMSWARRARGGAGTGAGALDIGPVFRYPDACDVVACCLKGMWMRLVLLDGFRGFFLIFMMIVHTNMEFGVAVGKLNHHSFGWVEDAQGFVFISGFVVGLVYGGRLLRRGLAACRTAVFSRIRTIYSHQAALIVIFTAAALVWPHAREAGQYLRFYTDAPLLNPLASLLLVSGSMHMGILAMYIWFMLLTPWALKLVHTGRGWYLIFLSVAAWLLAQTGLSQHLTAQLELALAQQGHPVKLGIFFNLLAWQVIYFSGLYLGYLAAAGRLDLGFLRDPHWFDIFKVGLALAIVLGVFDRIVFNELFGLAFSAQVLDIHERRDFTSLYMLAFALDLFLVTWLLVAGRDSGSRAVAALAGWVDWIFTRPALVFLGQHSLHVFSAHILAVYVINMAMHGREVDTLTASVIVLLSPLPLYLAAWLHQLSQERAKRRTAPSPAGAGPALRPKD